ncbi:MAG: hypothetical protein DRP01_07415 [Archaeoglobales archaeon]|nr:MAG: hypothetical protein DRP01_07415 [Archaeoglobales archaeon]
MRESIKLYQHSERLKSEIMIGVRLVKALESLRDEEFDGGSKIVSEFFSALNVEVGIAYNSTKDERFREVYEIFSDVDPVEIDSTMEKLRRAMIIIANCALDAYEDLQRAGLFK